MKLLKNTVWVMVIITMISCNFFKKTAKDIDVSKLDTPCKAMDAFMLCTKEYHAFLVKEVAKVKKTDKELSQEETEKLQEKVQFYLDLIVEISQHMKDQAWTEEEYEKCGKKKYEKWPKEIEDLVEKIEALEKALGRYINLPKDNATEYLNALKDKNWDKAKTLATPETAQNLDMMKSLGTDFGLTEVKDVRCKVDGDVATCTFCCTKDTSFNELKMKKIEDKWLAHQPKETPPPVDSTEKSSDQDNALNVMRGTWIGEMGGKKLTIVIEKVENGIIEGFNTLSNNSTNNKRALNGTYKPGDAYDHPCDVAFDATLNEPGDDKWDGVFTINFHGSNSKETNNGIECIGNMEGYEGIGEWESNNGKLKHNFMLEKK